MEDIDIARQAKLQNITKVAEKLGIEEVKRMLEEITA